jgi:hypothetical protein
MPGLRELVVAPQQDSAEAGNAAVFDGFVQVDVGLLLRGAVAAALDQEKRFGGVGQRNQEGMVAPRAVIGDVDALLAFGIRLDEGAVGIQDRKVEKLRGLLGPRLPCESG